MEFNEHFGEGGDQEEFIHQVQGGDIFGPQAVDFSEHLGEGGDDQEGFSHQVQGLIQGLEEISQHQLLVVPSEVEDDEVDFFQLSNEMAQHLEKIEQEHPGGLLTPDTSLNQSVPDKGSPNQSVPDEGSVINQSVPGEGSEIADTSLNQSVPDKGSPNQSVPGEDSELPDTSLSESVHGEGSELPGISLNLSLPGEASEPYHLPDQVPPPVVQKPSVEERDPRNARLDKKQLLEKLVDDLIRSKVKDTNSGKELSSTVRNQDELSKDEDNKVAALLD